MPIVFVKEMFCDRVAASKIYQGKKYSDKHPLEYYLKGNARSRMHDDTANTLEAWLKMLADDGEKKTFEYIKSLK